MIGLVRLTICVAGVYSTFLLWAIAQERLVSHPFPSRDHPIRLQPTASDGSRGGDRFPSPLFLTFVQAVASSICSFAYLVFGAWQDGSLRYKSKMDIIGWNHILSNARQSRAVRIVSTPGVIIKDKMEYPEVPTDEHDSTNVKANSDPRLHDGQLKGRGSRLQTPLPDLQPDSNGTTRNEREKTFADLGGRRTPWRKTLLGLVLQVAVFQTTAGPIGFLALEHISYPTMVLGKSCKLIPVLLLNVLIYRRRFSVHKYIVVALVTVGISLFMLFGNRKKKGGSDSLWGLTLLVINLFIDGLTNSTQDQIFSTYRQFTGQQMMFTMAILTQILLFPFLIMPLPVHPLSILHHLPIPLATHLTPQVAGAEIVFSRPAMRESIAFLLSHPTALKPLIAFASLGGLGQLFIFETIQHFGSLTLVMVTVTRKLFTMLLSVFLFHHSLTRGQWLGVTVVFLGIGVEAGIKRLDVIKRARRDNR